MLEGGHDALFGEWEYLIDGDWQVPRCNEADGFLELHLGASQDAAKISALEKGLQRHVGHLVVRE